MVNELRNVARAVTGPPFGAEPNQSPSDRSFEPHRIVDADRFVETGRKIGSVVIHVAPEHRDGSQPMLGRGAAPSLWVPKKESCPFASSTAMLICAKRS